MYVGIIWMAHGVLSACDETARVSSLLPGCAGSPTLPARAGAPWDNVLNTLQTCPLHHARLVKAVGAAASQRWARTLLGPGSAQGKYPQLRKQLCGSSAVVWVVPCGFSLLPGLGSELCISCVPAASSGPALQRRGQPGASARPKQGLRVVRGVVLLPRTSQRGCRGCAPARGIPPSCSIFVGCLK